MLLIVDYPCRRKWLTGDDNSFRHFSLGDVMSLLRHVFRPQHQQQQQLVLLSNITTDTRTAPVSATAGHELACLHAVYCCCSNWRQRRHGQRQCEQSPPAAPPREPIAFDRSQPVNSLLSRRRRRRRPRPAARKYSRVPTHSLAGCWKWVELSAGLRPVRHRTTDDRSAWWRAGRRRSRQSRVYSMNHSVA